jgi:hypothetical protein
VPFPLLATGLTGESEIDYHPFGEDPPLPSAGNLQLNEMKTSRVSFYGIDPEAKTTQPNHSATSSAGQALLPDARSTRGLSDDG